MLLCPAAPTRTLVWGARPQRWSTEGCNFGDRSLDKYGFNNFSIRSWIECRVGEWKEVYTSGSVSAVCLTWLLCSSSAPVLGEVHDWQTSKVSRTNVAAKQNKKNTKTWQLASREAAATAFVVLNSPDFLIKQLQVQPHKQGARSTLAIVSVVSHTSRRMYLCNAEAEFL